MGRAVNKKYIELLRKECQEWLDYYIISYDNFDDAWDDLCADVSETESTPTEYIYEVVWTDDFIEFCEEVCGNIEEVIKAGEYNTDLYARYMILEWYCRSEFYHKYEESEWVVRYTCNGETIPTTVCFNNYFDAVDFINENGIYSYELFMADDK